MAPSEQGDSSVKIAKDIGILKILLIVFGVVTLGLLVADTLRLFAPATVKTSPPGPPIIIRGGSVYGIAPIPSGTPNGWTLISTPSQPQILKSTGTFDDSYLAVDGVALSKGRPMGQYYASGLTTNWKVVLVFRNKDGGEPGDDDNSVKKLLVCSAQDCNTTAPLTSTSIYLVSDGSGTFSPGDADDPPPDGDDVQRYDLNSDSNGCSYTAGNGRHTKCNHLVRLRVIGVTQWNDGTTNPNKFFCPQGGCDVYAGSEK